MPLKLAGGALIKWLGGGTVLALLLGLGGWVFHEWQTNRLETAVAEADGRAQAAEARADSLRRDVSDWERSAGEAVRRAQVLHEELAAGREQVRQLQQRLEQRNRAYTALERQIRQAPDEDDGEVAPVLRDTLEGLP